ncbi:MAG: hypothetical protein NUV50_01050, partial [Rhodospirillales bacterium]|nr:hypothetical protein [Rhodospirillales bacterium]
HLSGLARALPDLNRLVADQRQRLDDWAERLGTSLQGGVHRRHRRLAESAGALVSPRQRLHFSRERLSQRVEHLNRAAKRLTGVRRRHLEQTARLLDSLSYQRVLDRGFALVSDAQGHAITSAKMLSAGDDITLSLKDGRVAARVVGGAPVKMKKVKKDNDKQGSLL